MSIPSYPTRLTAYPPEETALKREVMTHFGHMCVCPGCGETELHQLHLDHIRGGGNAERRAMKRRGTSFYREVKAAIDRDAPTDRVWLATLQILCLDCNLSKGNSVHCKIHGLMSVQGDVAQGLKDTMLGANETDVIDQEHGAASNQLVQFSGRCKRSTKQWLLAQPQAVGAVIDDLVEEKRSGEATVLAEVRTIATRQKEILAMLSNLTLPQRDPDPSVKESRVEHDFHYAILSPQPDPRPLAALPVSPPVESPSRWRRAWRRLWR